LIFGDSLSAGYGITIEQSWPNLLQKELTVSQSKFNIVNASISGETTFGGQQRIAKLLWQHRPAIVIVELGANDGLRGSSTSEMAMNLSFIIEQAQRIRAKVLLIGMKLPPNYGEAYLAKYENVFQTLAKKYRISLLPFLLEGVTPEQFQADNLHPLATAQPQIMRLVLHSLTPLLK
jgi:acyl-CoA thioesterase-1